MPDGQTPPSTDGGQAPTSGLPQAGTPAIDGQAPVSQATPTDSERIIAELRKENAAARKRLETFDKAQKEAEQAQLNEAERANKRATEAEQKIAQIQQQYVTAQIQLAAQKKNIIDPEIAAMAVQKMLEYDENGMPTNLEKALDELIKNKPYLVPQNNQALPGSPAQPGAPMIPAMNPPGRSSIPSPNTLPPGSRPRLSDLLKLQ